MNDANSICRQIRDDLLPLGLQEGHSEFVRNHLASCAECAGELEERERVAGLVRSLSRHEAPKGLTSFAEVRRLVERREQPALAQQESELRPHLQALRRIPAPSTLTDRVLGGSVRPRLRLLRMASAAAAAAVLLMLGFVSSDRSDHRLPDGIALGDAAVLEVVSIDLHDTASLDVR